MVGSGVLPTNQEKTMLKRPTVITLSLLFATFFGTAITATGSGGVRDSGDFFSEAAIKEATRKIFEIESQFKKELVVETFADIPEEVQRGVDLTDKPALNKMFEQWTVKEAKQSRVNGIYILISKEPAHLQIVVGNDTQNKAFTAKDREKLAGLMLNKLRTKKNDEALLECVQFVSTTMAGHVQPSTRVKNVAAPSAVSPRAFQTERATSWGWIITAIISIGAMWLIVGLLRSFMGGRRAAEGQGGMMPSAGGGGMFGSLLGGMFGAAAGMWLYDQFSGSHSNAWGGDQENRGYDSTEYSGQDTDYSGTGGDFGGDDNGGESGGGEGGDF